MTRLHDDFGMAAGDLVKLDNEWTSIERTIRDSLADLKAASYDAEPSDPVVWCDTHEQPVTACHKADHFCAGTPLAKQTDPTGEAAVGSGYDEARRWVFHAKQVIHHTQELVRIRNRNQPTDPRTASTLEQENAKPDGCEVCARSDKWVPAYVEAANPNGALQRPIRACRWHFDFVSLHGRLPDEREEAIHQAGGRVTVRATKQMDRLRRGLHAGAL